MILKVCKLKGNEVKNSIKEFGVKFLELKLFEMFGKQCGELMFRFQE